MGEFDIPPYMSVQAQDNPWSRKRLRLTKQRQRPDLPCRSQSFFTHLNYDVRILVYSYLSLSEPLKNIDDKKARSGLARTCLQAKKETDDEGRRQFWMFLRTLNKRYGKEKGGRCFALPESIRSKHDLAGLTELTLIVDGTREKAFPRDLLLVLARLQLDTVTIHLLGDKRISSTIDSYGFDAYQPSSILYKLIHGEIKTKRLILSWDDRHITDKNSFLDLRHFQACSTAEIGAPDIHTKGAVEDIITKWNYFTGACDEGRRAGFLCLETSGVELFPLYRPAHLFDYFSADTIKNIAWSDETINLPITWDLFEDDSDE